MDPKYYKDLVSVGQTPNRVNIIDPSLLAEPHNKKKQARLDLYEDIFNSCCQKIRYVNDVLYKKDCDYFIPYMKFGLPLYQTNVVVIYIMIKLREQGFDVKSLGKNHLYISWKRILGEISEVPGTAIATDTIDLHLDMKSTSVPKMSNTLFQDERFEKIEKEGCGGECCNNKKVEKKKITRKERLEVARQKQQREIEGLLRHRKRKGKKF